MAFLREDEHGFQVRWADPDGTARARRKGFSTRRQSRQKAQRAALRFLDEVERCELAGIRYEPPRPLRSPPLSEALGEYIRDYARPRAAATTRREAITLRVFREWVSGKHREPGVNVLSRDLVADYFEHLRSTPVKAGKALLVDKRRSNTTLRKLIETVERFWRWCHDHDVYGEHVGRVRKLELPAAVSSPTRAPTWAEMDACLGQFSGWRWRAVVVMRFAGLRVGQVMGLRWEHFDLDAGLLYFPGHLGKTLAEKRGRVIPLSPHLVAILAGWGARDGWLIEPGRDEDAKAPRDLRSREIGAAWRRAGVREEVWRRRPNHAFRKGFTSELKRSGADDEAVEHLVGRTLVGERGRYVDPSVLSLVEAVALVPPLGGSGVVALHRPMGGQATRGKRAKPG